jgi:tetratricopeptide (TPR) repeat protein
VRTTFYEGVWVNERLASMIVGTGRSPEQLVRAVNRRLVAAGLPALHRTAAYKWIEGCTPRGLVPMMVADVLSEWTGIRVTPADLGWKVRWKEPRVNDSLKWGAQTALRVLQAEMGDDVERRIFLAQSGLTITALANPWLLDPIDRVVDSIDGKRISHATVNDIESITAARQRMDDAVGGGPLLSAAREDLRVSVNLLTRASYSAEVGRRLFAATAEQARLVSWLCFDAGRHGLARHYTQVALRAAHASEDRRVGANVLGFAAGQAAARNDGAVAEAFCGLALAGGRGALTPAVESSIHARLGMARARLGDLAGATAAFEAAEELLAAAETEAEPAWIYWFTMSGIHGITGQSLMWGGRPEKAVTYLHQAVDETDEEFSRDKALFLSRKAIAHVQSGEVDEGQHSAENALEILSGPLESRYVEDVFTEFCETLRTHDAKAAADFRERLAAYSDARPGTKFAPAT